MSKFTGVCYGGCRAGEIATTNHNVWRAPVPIRRQVSLNAMWDEDNTAPTWTPDTYRVDRWIETAASKRGTVMHREVRFFLCDGHSLTVMERSRIFTDLRWAPWRYQQDTPRHRDMTARGYEKWRDEVQFGYRRSVIMATRKHLPIRSHWDEPCVEIESALEYGPAIPKGLMG